MKRLQLFAIAASLFLSAPFAPAQAQTKGKATAAPFVIQSATLRRTIMSGHEDVHIDKKIIIQWKSSAHPTAIYYRESASHWLKCRITRSEKRPFNSNPSDFMVMEVSAPLESIKPGEVLNLVPEQFPSDVQPDEVKAMPAGALFYKIGNSRTWQVMKVKMTKLPDLRHP